MAENIGSINASDGSTLLKLWSVNVPKGIRPIKKHSHICFEIALVEGGSGIYATEKKEYPMREGDIFIWGSNEQHCITDVGEEGLQIVNLHFEPRYLWGYSTDSLSEESINICFAHNKNFKNRISADSAIELRRLFSDIKNEVLEGKKEYQLTVKSLLNLFLIRLIRNFDYNEKGNTLSRDRLHSIRRVIKYIDNNLNSDISLNTLSEIAGMTPNYFSSLFHSVSGITLWDYINSKRIDLAIRLLLGEEQSILDIALACGFNNTANFNKAFKKHTGMTPSEYRRIGEVII